MDAPSFTPGHRHTSSADQQRLVKQLSERMYEQFTRATERRKSEPEKEMERPKRIRSMIHKIKSAVRRPSYNEAEIDPNTLRQSVADCRKLLEDPLDDFVCDNDIMGTLLYILHNEEKPEPEKPIKHPYLIPQGATTNLMISRGSDLGECMCCEVVQAQSKIY